jgi:hypothetical protein
MKPKYYHIIIAVLVVLNVVSWGFWWNGYDYRQEKKSKMNLFEKPIGDRGGRFIVNKLGFDTQQQQEFKQLREEYFNNIREIKKTIFSIREEIMNEVVETGEDLAKDSLFNRLGHQKSLLELATIKHYKQMRLICNEEQKVKLDSFFMHIITKREHMPMEHKYHRKRHKGCDQHP